MTEDEKSDILKRVKLIVQVCYVMILLPVIGLFLNAYNPQLFSTENEESAGLIVNEDVENGVHLPSGLIAEGDYELVVNNCTQCHSAALVTQNRMSAERWRSTIDWMQETQGLWNLFENEDKIIDYLVAYYPEATSNGRRPMLTNIEWYELED